MKHFVFKALSSGCLILCKLFDRSHMFLYREQFASIGKNVIFHPANSIFSYKTISIGNNVSIGERVFLYYYKSYTYRR